MKEVKVWLEDKTQVPYFSLDKEIIPLIKLLNDNGFKTTGSCQGGEGHAFSLPTVSINTSKGHGATTVIELPRFLIEKRIYGFSVKEINMYQSSWQSRMPESYIELEIWSKESLEVLNERTN